MKQLFLYLHEMYKCSWVLGSFFFSSLLYLMCVSSRLRAQRDKCTVHPHHNSTMFNYSPSKDTGQLSFKLVDIFMDDREPTKSVLSIRIRSGNLFLQTWRMGSWRSRSYPSLHDGCNSTFDIILESHC